MYSVKSYTFGISESQAIAAANAARDYQKNNPECTHPVKSSRIGRDIALACAIFTGHGSRLPDLCRIVLKAKCYPRHLLPKFEFGYCHRRKVGNSAETKPPFSMVINWQEATSWSWP